MPSTLQPSRYDALLVWAEIRNGLDHLEWVRDNTDPALYTDRQFNVLLIERRLERHVAEDLIRAATLPEAEATDLYRKIVHNFG